MNILMIASETYIAFKLNLAYILINAINIKSSHFKNSRLSESFYYNLVVAMTSIWIDCYTCYFLLLSHNFFFFLVLIFIVRFIRLSPYSQISILQR
jgi:hypothetical protein